MLRVKSPFVSILALLLILQGQLHSQNKSVTLFDIQPGKNRTVVIQWSTSQGLDSFDYAVEKSINKESWETISTIKQQLSHSYSSIDFHPAEGINYYRIRQSKLNGEVAFSELKWIQISRDGKLYIWPNPANDVLHVKSPFTKGSINIVDAEGNFISKIAITNFITNVTISHLPGGIYFLQLSHNNKIFVEKFVKD